MKRRAVLTTAIGSILLSAGCTMLEQSNQESSPSGTAQTTDTRTSPPDSGIPILKITDVAANPAGPDSKNLTLEILRLEFTVDIDSFDLSGFTLTATPDGGTYEFTSFIGGDIQRGTGIKVHSGSGNRWIAESKPPEYGIYIGSANALLNNNGGTVILGNPEGTTISEVIYPALAEGETFVVAERIAPRSTSTTTKTVR